jgi:hypothetical protein
LAELFAVVRSVGQGEAMTYLIIKAAVSGILVMIISEVARRSPGLGGLIASLPLVSLLGIIWLWRDTSDLERIASHAESTFWFVLPSLPMFLVFPAMLRNGIGFWLGLILRSDDGALSSHHLDSAEDRHRHLAYWQEHVVPLRDPL